MTRLLAILVLLGSQRLAEPCGETSACVAWLTGNTPATVISPVPAEITGRWAASMGLGGSTLYSFHDGTYIYTEWTDLFPETIYDKGRWQITGSVVVLTPDADVKWQPKTDRRYVLARIEGVAAPVLLGLDQSLQILKTLMASEPDNAAGYARAAGLPRKASLAAHETRGLRSRLMRDAWRPSFFDAAK